MQEFKVGDLVIFKSEILKAYFGGLAKDIVEINGTKALLDIFIGREGIHTKKEFDIKYLIKV